MQKPLAHSEITEAIIGAAFEVHGALGYGFLEAVYRNAMAIELKSRGFTPLVESRMEVGYKGEVVGTYIADMLVNESVIVELKVAEQYRKADEAQLLNELAATRKAVGLLINFGRQKVESNASLGTSARKALAEDSVLRRGHPAQNNPLSSSSIRGLSFSPPHRATTAASIRPISRRNFFNATIWIWRIRSRVMPNFTPISSSVFIFPPPNP